MAMPAIHHAILVAAVLLGACDGGAQTPTKRDYEYHLHLDDEQAAGLWKSCPTDDKSPLMVRWLADGGQGGVDVRVEFSDYMSEARAACVWAYLTAHGSKEFETDTQAEQPGASGGVDTTTGDATVADPSTTGGLLTGPDPP